MSLLFQPNKKDIKTPNLKASSNFRNKECNSELKSALSIVSDQFGGGKFSARGLYFEDRKKLLREKELNTDYIKAFKENRVIIPKNISDLLEKFDKEKLFPQNLKEGTIQLIQSEIKKLEVTLNAVKRRLDESQKESEQLNLELNLLQKLQDKEIKIEKDAIEIPDDIRVAIFESVILKSPNEKDMIARDKFVSYNKKTNADPKEYDLKLKVLEDLFLDFRRGDFKDIKDCLKDRIRSIQRNINYINGVNADKLYYSDLKDDLEAVSKNLKLLQTNDINNLDVKTIKPFLFAVLKTEDGIKKIEEGNFPEILNRLSPKNKWGDNVSVITSCEQETISVRNFQYRARILKYLSESECKSLREAVKKAERYPLTYKRIEEDFQGNELLYQQYQIPICSDIPEDVFVKGAKKPTKILIVIGSPNRSIKEEDEEYFNNELKQTIRILKEQYNLKDENFIIDDTATKKREGTLESKFIEMQKFAEMNENAEAMVVYIGHGLAENNEEGLQNTDQGKQGSKVGTIYLKDSEKGYVEICEDSVKDWSRNYLKDFKHVVFFMDTCHSGAWRCQLDSKPVQIVAKR